MTPARTPWVEALFGVAFALALVTPVVVMLARGDDTDVILQREQRFPTPTPEVPRTLEEWAAFPGRTDMWYSERFGLRNDLVHAFHWSKVEVFDESPTTNLVIGRDDWLFSDVFSALDCLRGALPMTQEELTAWRESLVAKRAWLAGKGIDYVLVIVPGKGTVYPEQLPEGYDIVGPSRREQLLEELALAPEVHVIDLLPRFLADKADDAPDDHLYYPLGLHWTARGALAGYQEVMSRLPERHRSRASLTADDYAVERGGRGDDFSHSFLVKERFVQDEPILRLEGRKGAWRENGERDDGSCWFPTWGSPQPSPTVALFQRDSFGQAVLPKFAQHFRTLTDCTTLQFSPTVIDACEPDLVVELWVEHTLGYEIPHVHRAFEQAVLRERFERLPVELLPATQEGEAPRMTSLRDTRIRATRFGMRMLVEGVAAAKFEPVAWDADAETILRLDISAPARTYATLFYPLPGLSTYRLKQSSQLPLEPGRQTLYLALPPQRFPGSIAIAPGCALGDYMIHDVEIRTSSE